ncbi:MAG: hypothetical protein GHCLOJNM_00716 [bacterium]|nr:hypothetical protein [bacterium]
MRSMPELESANWRGDHIGTTRVWGLVLWVFAWACLSSCSSLQPKATTWPEVLERLPPTREEVALPLVEIPSGATESPYAGVRVTCGGNDLLFQIDTGSSVTVLRESLRRDLRLRPMGKAEAEGFGAESTEQDLHWTSSLALGDLALKAEPVTFLADSKFDQLPKVTPTRVDGILGASLLQRGEIEFDGPNRRLIIRPFEKSTVQDSQNWIQLAHYENVNGYVVPLETGERSRVRFLLDTGSNVPLIFEEGQNLGARIKETHSIGESECSTFRGTYTLKAYRLPLPLGLGGYRFQPGLTVYVEPREDPSLDGSIGIPVIWSCKRVVLNRSLERAVFEPREAGPLS